MEKLSALPAHGLHPLRNGRCRRAARLGTAHQSAARLTRRAVPWAMCLHNSDPDHVIEGHGRVFRSVANQSITLPCTGITDRQARLAGPYFRFDGLAVWSPSRDKFEPCSTTPDRIEGVLLN
jgi:hypothetical protein